MTATLNVCLQITFSDSLNPDQDQQNVAPDLDTNCLKARFAKCPQISIFAMPVAFTRKYWQIMENTGKNVLQPSTFRFQISILIEVI